jgi:serine/threonine protein kinase
MPTLFHSQFLSMTFSDLSALLDEKGYNFVKEIGRGASARCYLVFSRYYQDYFVAKVVNLSLASCCEVEPSTLKGLNHPNIIYLYDVVSTQGALYLFLEYCPGGSLVDIAAKHGVFSGRQLYGLCKAVLTGLAFIHSKRCAHLDLKPANILIDRHGRAKLADFGLSRWVHGSMLERRAGTLRFCAPELFQPAKYDPFKADIWSFAVTMFVLAFEAFPFAQPKVGGPMPSYEFAEIAFPMNADPLVVEALKAMFVIDPEARPTALECLRLPIFVGADVVDGRIDSNGNQLGRVDEPPLPRVLGSSSSRWSMLPRAVSMCGHPHGRRVTGPLRKTGSLAPRTFSDATDHELKSIPEVM